VTLNIKPATDTPVTVSGDHVDSAFEASKVKVGESITLTITTKDGTTLLMLAMIVSAVYNGIQAFRRYQRHRTRMADIQEYYESCL
ncbi:intracellular growth attenuator family protein, partial [Salmonella enterica subsp. enterica serovar Kentucky]|nr:intracellular growth attenuator family protein [Salmonella enterica subsp. enterica serovar Kentucky]